MKTWTVGDGAHFVGDGIYVIGAGKVATVKALKSGGFSLRAKMGNVRVYLTDTDQIRLANYYLRERAKWLSARYPLPAEE